VESPAKARTIKKYLGSGYEVKASVGHIKDLPKSKIGVDVDNGFQPEYEIIRGKGKIISEIKRTAKAVKTVYLAPDPDREGEAIAWHLAEEIRPANRNIKRILFNEITKRGITDALQNPAELDEHKFDSQQARRVLDRLVGYEISPILWKKVRRGLSAGRVQSVAVRIVVDREREIAAFKPQEFWTISCGVQGATPPPFRVRLAKLDGQPQKAKALANAVETNHVADEIRRAKLVVERIERKERKRSPLPPFITSKLQQEAARKLRFTTKKTMALAQRLYEGLDLGEEGPVGLITYMRTDSTRLSADAVAEVRDYIGGRYGAASLPDEAVVYKSKKGAQDAHEAIRPTSTKYEPETVRRLLLEAASRKGEASDEKQRDAEDHFRLYQLIWNRFVACQMRPAVYDQTTIDVAAGRATLRATGQVLRFAGYTAVYEESPTEDKGDSADGAADEEGAEATLPEVREGEALALLDVAPEQHFTQPPPRFTEASLVKELEDKGIGRPSTYANILSTIQDRGYVEKKEGRFFPTVLGTKVNDLLVGSFPDILDVAFTAGMEEDLDKVEDGEVDWVKLLERFYRPFKLDLDNAHTHMKDLKREEIPTEHKCEKCGSTMVIKWGRNGEFLACSGYPECKNTKEFARNADGTVAIVLPSTTTDEKCESCGSQMVVKRGRFGEFLACSRYPECKSTKPISLGVDCPKGCGGFLTEKRSKRGKVFFGCSNYTKTGCDFVSWDRPIAEPCPSCGAPFLVRKESRRSGSRVRCIREGCGYAALPPQPHAEGDAA
jgi:DNA topoisomerase-1